MDSHRVVKGFDVLQKPIDELPYANGYRID